MTTTTPTAGTEHRTILRTAERTWRRSGVRRHDRALLHTELSTELAGAHADGLGTGSVLGDDPGRMLLDWADERGMSGRALRLCLVLPTAFIGLAAGMSLVLIMLFAAFRGWSDALDPGRFALAFYAAGGALGYLCALVFVGSALRRFGDPQAAATTRRLAMLLPAGALVCVAGGVAVAAVRHFTTTPATFVAVAVVVTVGIAATVSLARYTATRPRPA